MDIFTDRQESASAGYESASREVDVASVNHPGEAQLRWMDPAKHERKVVRIVNPSAVAVTVKIEKGIIFTDTEPGVVVESGGLTEFLIPERDEITINLELLCPYLDIFLKALNQARVSIYLAGR